MDAQNCVVRNAGFFFHSLKTLSISCCLDLEGSSVSGFIFKKNQVPEGFMNIVLNKYLDKGNESTAHSVDSKPPDSLCTFYFKVLYVILSNFTKHKLHTLVKRYCKNLKSK